VITKKQFISVNEAKDGSNAVESHNRRN